MSDYTTSRPDYASSIEKDGRLILAGEALSDMHKLQAALSNRANADYKQIATLEQRNAELEKALIDTKLVLSQFVEEYKCNACRELCGIKDCGNECISETDLLKAFLDNLAKQQTK